MRPSMPIVSHAVTHQGRRASNEDAFLAEAGLGLFVVADGMGGHRAGEVAADLAIRTIASTVRGGGRRGGALLIDAVQRANDEVLAAAGRTADWAGMGTTITAVLCHGLEMAYVNVGDSRLYRLREDTFDQLTADDSWVWQVRASGVSFTEAELGVHPMRHVLTRVVGIEADLEPTLHEDGSQAGDVLLLCSDGLHGVVPDEWMAETLRTSGASAAQRLVDEALARGGTDNVTALVVTLT